MKIGGDLSLFLLAQIQNDYVMELDMIWPTMAPFQ
jgi:hypothetical protein